MMEKTSGRIGAGRIESRNGQVAPIIDPDRPKSGLFLIGPEEAHKLLLRNQVNRPLSTTSVNTLAEEMAKGWMPTPDAIGFDVNGQLVNGQHRLHAVIKSRMSVPMHVITGLDVGAFEVTDTGRVRSGADMLSILNYKYRHIVSGVCRMELLREAGVMRMRIQPRDVVRMAGRIQTINEAVYLVYGSYKDVRGWCSMTALAWCLTRAIGQKRCMDWFGGITIGASLEADDPRFVLRRRFQTTGNRGERRNGTDQTISQIHLLWKSWEMFSAGETCQRLQLPREGFGIRDLWPSVPDWPQAVRAEDLGVG